MEVDASASPVLLVPSASSDREIPRLSLLLHLYLLLHLHLLPHLYLLRHQRLRLSQLQCLHRYLVPHLHRYLLPHKRLCLYLLPHQRLYLLYGLGSLWIMGLGMRALVLGT